MMFTSIPVLTKNRRVSNIVNQFNLATFDYLVNLCPDKSPNKVSEIQTCTKTQQVIETSSHKVNDQTIPVIQFLGKQKTQSMTNANDEFV